MFDKPRPLNKTINENKKFKSAIDNNIKSQNYYPNKNNEYKLSQTYQNISKNND